MCGDEIEVIGKANENKDKEHFLKVVQSYALSPTPLFLILLIGKMGYTFSLQFRRVLVR